MLEAWFARHGATSAGGTGSSRIFGGHRSDLRRYLSLSRMEEEEEDLFGDRTTANLSGYVTLRDASRRRPARPTSLPVVSTTCLASIKDDRSVYSSPPASAQSSVASPSSSLITQWKYEVSSFYQMRFLHLSDGRGHIGEGGGGGGGGLCTEGGVADDKELGAYWELLDSELRPIEPVLSCPESLSIFSEHKEMAKKYLILQQEIFNLQHKKGVLEEKLSQAEKLEHLGNQRYQDKIRELENKRENLRRTRSKLRQQLEQICLRQEEQQQRQNHQEDVTGDGISHNHPLSPP